MADEAVSRTDMGRSHGFFSVCPTTAKQDLSYAQGYFDGDKCNSETNTT